MSSLQYVKWYPVNEKRPTVQDEIGLHVSQDGKTKPVLSHETIIKNNRKEQFEKNELEQKKLLFASIAKQSAQQNKPERVPVEQRIKERPEPEPIESDQSLLVEQTREILLDFQIMLKKYLYPDYPIRRTDRKKYVDEINRFRKTGFIEIVRAIKIKVDALCSFENVYDRSMFDLEEKSGWFNNKVKEVLEQKNFESAQYVISSVMQIVMQDEVVVQKRKLMSKMK
ncbi:MAG: hypothetical protein UT24_C0024G0007 [Candidatus Woesebacteria bacterium GW2011_GWB1_39_12]|uniref:Uncharacterized protein n=1 Tax=Candidatus Woesebacteria bacterium GW2011_GWB1_39_12 TaxID=1618574 RepID=A0A0G0M7W4_9BACT|nr:MAG: hypothetical protein UT24_C0024G0007 [Candidatus Woesebacteria bacterium GW2011_GWB1_39_12]